MTQPYIGITGFTQAIQPELLLMHIRPDTKRKFMVGVLANTDTLNGGTVAGREGRFPQVEDIAGIFPDDARSLNLIHFNTRDKKLLGEELQRLAAIAGPNLDGFQLNVCWPNPQILADFCVDFPNLTIVLQVGGGAMRRVEHNPTKLANQLAKYTDLAHYVLIDPSGGRGERFEPNRASDQLHAAVSSGFQPVVAGGLSADTLDAIPILLDRFPDLSWDAEGRLMKEEGDLSPSKCSRYLGASFALL